MISSNENQSTNKERLKGIVKMTMPALFNSEKKDKVNDLNAVIKNKNALIEDKSNNVTANPTYSNMASPNLQNPMNLHQNVKSLENSMPNLGSNLESFKLVKDKSSSISNISTKLNDDLSTKLSNQTNYENHGNTAKNFSNLTLEELTNEFNLKNKEILDTKEKVLFYNKLNRLHRTKIDILKEKINEITKICSTDPNNFELLNSISSVNNTIKNVLKIYSCFNNKLTRSNFYMNENSQAIESQFYNDCELKQLREFKEIN